MTTAIDEILLVDLAFDDDLIDSPSGDIDVAGGLTNLKNSIFRRIITTPGSLIHRPTYGVGLKLFQNATGSLENIRKLTRDIEAQLKQESRIEEIKSIAVSNPEAGMFKIAIGVIAKGYGLVNYDFLIGDDE